MMPKKIIGWSLLAVGLLIIFWSIYSSYNIFTGKKPAPEIFKTTQGEKSPLAQQPKSSSAASEEQIKAMLNDQLGEQIKGIIPADFLPKILNLASWSIFATILFFGGGKISGIGIKLLKEKE